MEGVIDRLKIREAKTKVYHGPQSISVDSQDDYSNYVSNVLSDTCSMV